MTNKWRWQHSLYSRALIFTIIGCGCLLGAVLVQTHVIISGTVERLLQERISLARSTGSYLEEVVHRELDQMGGAVLKTMSLTPGSVNIPAIRAALAGIYGATLFQEGAFVLDSVGRVLAAVPEEQPAYLANVTDLAGLLAAARKSEWPVNSNLIRLHGDRHNILVMLAALRGPSGEPAGFIGGLLDPASNNLLAPFKGSSGTTSTLQLVNATGTVVASTAAESLFHATDHGSVLKDAIAKKREVHGRCHSCHESGNAPISRELEVLAFAPLPHLSLGMAVRQPEKQALAPAFLLQQRLIWLGSAFVVLFLIFTGLSVHSVVAPLLRLTRAVRVVENETSFAVTFPQFGSDEVGQLAGALERWRNQMIYSLHALRTQERALEQEIEDTRLHLASLQEIGESGSGTGSMERLMETSLSKLLEQTGFTSGVLALSHGKSIFSATRGAEATTAEKWLARARELDLGSPETFRATAGAWNMRMRWSSNPSREKHLRFSFSTHAGLEIHGALSDGTTTERAVEERKLQSLLHQIAISAANLLLHRQDALRQEQSREFLQKVLAAQEDERKRVARELHDTIAQDLTAHRLEIERLTANAGALPAGDFIGKLRDLDSRAQGMIVTLRQLLHDLRPSVLDTMGFLPALQWYLERTKRDHGIRGALSVEGNEVPLKKETEVSLFRIFQEGLQNVVQHSKADHLVVTVNYLLASIELTMEDDGNGFDVEALLQEGAKKEGRGLGLLGIRERARLLSGEMELESQPGEGTTLHVRIPLEPEKSHA